MNKKHGLSHTRIDCVYKSMKARCYNASNSRYMNYGARGIKVCDEWLNNKNSFFEWAANNGYDPNALRGKNTLDRIDVNGDYCPENCRFVDMEIQNNNRRNNHLISYNGETHTIREWEKIKGINSGTLWNRIMILNWDVERALG